MRGARDTIVAVASPPGRALRALVRASGPGVRDLARRAFGAVPASRGISRVRLRLRDADRGEAIECPAIAFWMEGPASFTGEDSLEISCVGAPALVERVALGLIEHAVEAGHPARLAQPGEFAWRAHCAGRLGVDEAEALAARIAATSDAELAASADAARGVYGARAADLCGRTAELLARVEAGIDFTDQEDVVSIRASETAAACAALAEGIASMRGATSVRAQAVPFVVLAGKPNAGKSSLFNALLGRARSVESARAGTTRDAVVARATLPDGVEIDLADLAGLESAAQASAPREIAESMQRRALEMIAVADLVVRCTPVGAPRAPLAREDGVVEVATMCDRVDATRADGALPPPPDAVVTSARTGTGLDRLRAELAARLRSDRALRRAQLANILPRHDAALASAHAALADAKACAEADRHAGDRLREPELVAGLLRAALDALGAIAGPVHPDDVLGLVFSRFCIGK